MKTRSFWWPESLDTIMLIVLSTIAVWAWLSFFFRLLTMASQGA